MCGQSAGYLNVKTGGISTYHCDFFFFHWHYSPLWALACRTMSFHFFLCATNSLHLLTPSAWRSLCTSSFHLFLSLPLLLIPSSSWVKIFLGILSTSILSRWPNQLILCPFIHFTIFSPFLISPSSQFGLDSQGCEILYKVCLWQQRWNQEPERNRCKKGLPRCIVCYWPCAILKSPCLGRQGRQVR